MRPKVVDWSIDYRDEKDVFFRDGESFSFSLIFDISYSGDEGADIFQLSFISPDWVKTSDKPLCGVNVLMGNIHVQELAERVIFEIESIDRPTSESLLGILRSLLLWELDTTEYIHFHQKILRC